MVIVLLRTDGTYIGVLGSFIWRTGSFASVDDGDLKVARDVDELLLSVSLRKAPGECTGDVGNDTLLSKTLGGSFCCFFPSDKVRSSIDDILILSLVGTLTHRVGRTISVAGWFRLLLFSFFADFESLVVAKTVLEEVELAEGEHVERLSEDVDVVETVVASDAVLDMGLDDMGESMVVDADERLLFTDEDAFSCVAMA